MQHIYRAMDAIEHLSSEIQTAALTAACTLSGGVVDCCHLDFESISEDDVRDFGFSKDQK